MKPQAHTGEDLFSHAARLEASKRARDAGMEQVDDHANDEWSALMDRLVIEVATKLRTFTSDDVFDLFDEVPDAPVTHDLRAFGPVMMRAAKAGVCRKAETAPRPSRRKSLHASPRAVWTSLIFKGV